MKFEYVKLTHAKKEYYLKPDQWSKFRQTDWDEENDYDAFDCGFDKLTLGRRPELKVEKLKFRKADSFTYSDKREIDTLRKYVEKIGAPIAKKENAKSKARHEKYLERQKREDAAELKRYKKMAKEYPLPKGMKAEDLMSQKDGDYATNSQKNSVDFNRICVGGYQSFKMYYANTWGWCVPTLRIASARRGSGWSDRAYAVRVSNGELVRVGNGPHVKFEVYVYPKKSNFNRLRPLFNLMHGGAIKANETRDRISTRMMRRRHAFWQKEK